jgi:hypothetical protein
MLAYVGQKYRNSKMRKRIRRYLLAIGAGLSSGSTVIPIITIIGLLFDNKDNSQYIPLIF